MDLFRELQLDVEELLAELGQDVVFERYGRDVDFVTGASVEAVEATQTLRAASLPVSTDNVRGLDVGFLDGAHDLTQVRLLIVSAVFATFVPSVRDRVLVGGVRHEVLGCTPINVDGATDVAFVVGARK